MYLFSKLFGLPNVKELREKRDIDRLLQTLRHGDDYARLAATHALGALGDLRAVRPLCLALHDKHFTVRLAAVRALGTLKDPRAIGPLCRALYDVTIGVRLAAAQAIAELKDVRAVEPLCGQLSHWNAEIRAAAVRALGAIKSPLSVGPLCAVLSDEDASVRVVAVWALGELKDPRSAGPLCAILSDPDPRLRAAAAGLLGELKHPHTVEALCAALHDHDIDVRTAAAAALGQIKDPRALAPLIDALSTQRFHVDLLRWALQRRNSGLRKAAVVALGQEERPTSVDIGLLRAALCDSDTEVCDAGVAALEQLAAKFGRVRTDPLEQQHLKERLADLATVELSRWILLRSATYGPMTPGGDTLMERSFSNLDAVIQFVVDEKPWLRTRWSATSDAVLVEYSAPNGRLHARYVILKQGKPERYLCYLAWLMVRHGGYQTRQLQAAS
jgi:HEAT repeat protein